MKLRTGFVSNSSSSSFIIHNATTIEVFKVMLMCYFKNLANYDYISKEEFEETLESKKYKANLFLAKHNNTKDINIMIPYTCNYETVIVQDGNNVLVNTCNNHNWDDLYDAFKKIESKYDEDVVDNVACYNIETGDISNSGFNYPEVKIDVKDEEVDNVEITVDYFTETKGLYKK